MAEPETQTAEDPQAAATARRLIGEIGASEKAQNPYLTRARKIVSKYKQEGAQRATKRRFALLWSNTETLLPSIYSRPPEPVVMRRFGDADPVGRVASEVLERALKYSVDRQDLDGALGQTALDYTLIARAITWERYVPTFGPQVTPEIPLQLKTDGAEDDGDDADDAAPVYVDPDGNPVDLQGVKFRDDDSAYMDGAPYQPVVYEESITDYVNYEDFGHGAARTWDEVDLVWRRTYLSRSQLKERFGDEIGGSVTLDWGGPKDKPRTDADDFTRKAAIYEVWVKSEKKVYWISKSYAAGPLDARDDPLKLDGFFPCPRPLLATIANDSLIPVPDYVYYQDQAEEVDDLTAKISELQDALKVVGLYAGEKGSNLSSLLKSANNTLIPVPDWVSLKESGGVRGVVEWWPIDQVVSALQAMIAQRQQLINDVYQITGIGDILRGMNDPRATATAEQIKGQWGTLRVRDRQKEMQRFARDILRIKGEVIASKFDIDTLKAMTNLQLPMQADKDALTAQLQQQAAQAQMAAMQQAQAQAQMAGPMPGGPAASAAGQGAPPPAPPPAPTEEQQRILASPTWEDVLGRLRDNATRCFTIDIETDSTIEPNEQEEKAQAVEFIQAVGNMIAQWGAAIEAQPLLAPMAGEFLKWGARKFRTGRQLEDVIDRTIDNLTQSLNAGPPPGQQQQDQGAAAANAAKLQEAAMRQQTDAAKIASQERIAQGDQALHAQELQLQAGELQIKNQDQQLKALALSRDPHPQAIQ